MQEVHHRLTDMKIKFLQTSSSQKVWVCFVKIKKDEEKKKILSS